MSSAKAPSAMKLALMAEQVRGQVRELSAAQPIAIVGMACRFPGGVSSLEQYWQLLRDGVDAVSEIPPDRWDLENSYDPDPAVPGKSSIRHAGLLDRIDTFDAPFFGILPREAERMDPQQRIFMEVAMEALEHAGLSRERIGGSRTGVYVAAYHTDYARRQFADLESIDARTLTGTLNSVIGNRLSYFLDLRGPSLTLDSACSSSLVAVHLACQSLRTGETDAAFAGGVSIAVSPDLMVALSKVGFTSKTGRCRTFDVQADGFVRGEGCGVVVLKRLSDAVGAGDRILAVIRSSAVNQDGRSTVLAAPNGLAQRAMIREALKNGHVEPTRIGFIETHGTGTALGDPIEVEAIASTVGASRADGSVCYLGSVKANLGHLEAAAGVAGLIKATLVLQHAEVPRQINFERLNPHLLLEGTCLRVPTSLEPWPAGHLPRVAAVSSFGVGGTNAHTVIEEAPALPIESAGDVPEGPYLLPLSAQSPVALRELAARWVEFLEVTQNSVAELCAAAAMRRSHYDHRLAVAGSSVAELRGQLSSVLRSEPLPPASPAVGTRSGRRRLAFVFAGQGGQWYAMGRELVAREAVFRDVLTDIDARFREIGGWSLLEELEASESDSRLGETRVAQPAIFAVQVALAALWKSWGIEPDGVVGHSIGELAALHVCGALSLDAAVRVVWLRAQAMHRATGQGAMAAVGLSEADARRLVQPYGEELSVAAVNSPRGVVLSGRPNALASALRELEQQGVSHRALSVNCAFHSTQMASIAAEFAASLGNLKAEAPLLPFYSTVTGGIDESLRIDASYFARNVRDPVYFSRAVNSMLDDGFSAFLEIGPHPVLGTSIAECADARRVDATLYASLRRARPERDCMLNSCAALYAAGFLPRWEGFNSLPPPVLDLPNYPWQRERYWLRNPPVVKADSAALSPLESGVHGLLGRRIPCASAHLFTATWPDPALNWLADHRVAGRVLMPAAGMLEALRAAAGAALHAHTVEVRELVVHHPLVISDDDGQPVTWQIAAHEVEEGHVRLTLHEAIPSANRGTGWRLIASAVARLATAEDCVSLQPTEEYPPDDGRTDDIYTAFSGLGVPFGPEFRTIRSLHVEGVEGSGWLECAASADDSADSANLHPGLLDGALQMCVTVATGAGTGVPQEVLLPLGVDRYAVLNYASSRLHASVEVRRESDGGSLTASVKLRAPDGTLVAVVEGARFAPLGLRSSSGLAPADDWLYEVGWRSLPRDEVEYQQAVHAKTTNEAWVVFVDDQGIGDALVEILRKRGRRCLRVHAGERLAQIEPDLWSIDPSNPAHFEAVLTERDWREGNRLAGIVHLWSLRAPLAVRVDEPPTLIDHDHEDLFACGSVMHTLQAMARSPEPTARMVVVTCGAQPGGGAVTRPAAAGVWGLLAAAFAESPDMPCRVLDLDPDALQIDAAALAAELLRTDPAPRRLILRGARRLVPQLRHLQPAERERDAIRLQSAGSGTLDGLNWHPATASVPSSGEVRIRVSAAGLNFRDVLLALGMYPGGDGTALGGECAGVVESVGAGVTQLKPGDEVFGFAQGSLATEVTVPAAFLARVPSAVPVEIAAALPVAYLTAMFGLHRIAGMRAGTKVLVHAATGGVGMAAVQLARRAGAEIFATAGSPAKRRLLATMGVAHVFDSRSTTFATEILELTGGAGVDIVLNSLAGEFITASFTALTRGGYFLELGKRDIWSIEHASRVRPDAHYVPYDLGTEAYREPALLGSLLTELIAGLEDGTLQPLPVRVFEFEEAQDAFRLMAQARHTGKIVLRAPRQGAAKGDVSLVQPDATYWITGGLGALGIRTARWLVELGARHLVLTGRSAPGLEASALIDEFTEQGARVCVRIVDAADAQAMSAVLQEIRETLPPLRGVVHAAGVLDDGVLLTQKWPRLLGVLRGKAHGARVLDAVTRDLRLDFFVLYSAAGLLLGPRGQPAYSAANAELDALAYARRAAGLPALSVAWGAWAEAGMAADMLARGADNWSARGLGWITPKEGFSRLERLLHAGVTHAAIMPIDWSRFVASLAPDDDLEYFSEVAPIRKSIEPTGRQADRAQSIADQWRSAPASRRRSLVLAHILRSVLDLLGVDSATVISERVALKEVGLDSLMAVELRNSLTRSIGQSLPATLLFDYPSLDALTSYLLRTLQLDGGGPAAPARTEFQVAGAANVALLSDDEAEAQLLAELETGRGEEV